MLGLSSAQIPAIGQSAMEGFTYQQLSTLNPDLCAFFTNTQAFYLNSDSCSGMTLNCLQNFQLDSISGLGSTCFEHMDDGIFSYLSEDHITHIGCGGFEGVNARKFSNALINIGISLVDSIDYQKMAIVSLYTINSFIDNHWGTHQHLMEQAARHLCIQKELSWLKVIYSNSSSATCLNSRDLLYEPLNFKNTGWKFR
jgi:hypothetical protein